MNLRNLIPSIGIILTAGCFGLFALMPGCGHHVSVDAAGESIQKGSISVHVDPANAGPRKASATIPDKYAGKVYSYEFRDASGNRISGGDGKVNATGDTKITVPVPPDAASLSISLDSPPASGSGLSITPTQTIAGLSSGARKNAPSEFDVITIPIDTISGTASFITVEAMGFIRALENAHEVNQSALAAQAPIWLKDVAWMTRASLTPQGLLIQAIDSAPQGTLHIQVNDWSDSWSADGSAPAAASAALTSKGWWFGAVLVPLDSLHLSAVPGVTSKNAISLTTDDSYSFVAFSSTAAF